MLSSAATSVAPGALLLANSRLAAKRPASDLLSKSRQQSTRNITFGWWAAHHDRDQQREMRRRYKASRNRCSDAVSKKLLWEQQSGSSCDAARPTRHNVHHYWQSTRSFAFTRHRSAKESPQGKSDVWASALGDMRTIIGKSQASFLNKAGLGASETSSPSASASNKTMYTDYVIDPITNRKVSKVSAKSAPDESVGISPSPLAAAPTYDADFPPTKSELKAYDNVNVDSRAEIPSADSEKKYDDLHKYKPISHNEPDGKPSDAPVELGHEGYDPAEVQKYKPFQYNEPDGKPADATVELGHLGYDPAEVQKYQPFMWNEPDGKPTTPVEAGHHGYDPAEVAQYKPFMWNEPDGKPSISNEEQGHHGYDPAEVKQYGAFRYNEPDGKPTVPTGEVGHHGYDQAEVQTYQAFRYNEPDGKPAVSTGEVGHHGYDQADVQQYKAYRYNEPDGKPPAVNDSTSESLNEYDTKASPKTTDEIYSNVLRKIKDLSTQHKESKPAKTLAHAERAQAMADPYSREPQGLETSYASECGSESAGLPFVKIRRSTNRPSVFEATNPAAPQTLAEPYVYKILAYDPAKHTVDIVQTTSTVSDAATPLTPAEVLLRVSSPAKFLPHFASLQEEGFEVVSGSGDVMVFRKVQGPSRSTIFTAVGASAVNPIDITGKEYVPPSTAKSVSPTESPHLAQAFQTTETSSIPSSKKFKSNIDVRREEVVFSGAKPSAENFAGAKKPGVVKRMAVGATWVAGISYGLGLASEYLKGM